MNLSIISFLILLLAPESSAIVTKQLKVATTVTIQNSCPGTEEKFLVKKNSIRELFSNTKDEKRYQLGPAAGSAYPLIICTDTQCYHYGNMTFLSGQDYLVKITNCNFPGVRIESHEIMTKKSSAPAMIRFRSRRVSPTEYRYNQSRFRRLSVGMSKYNALPLESLPETRVQFRYRISSDGPVSYMSTHALTNLQLGHRYFIEVEYIGTQKEIIKIQDEGLSCKNEK